jgi:hypothetical protein
MIAMADGITNLTMRKKQLSLALDSLTADEFVDLMLQINKRSLDRFLRILSPSAADTLREDLEKARLKRRNTRRRRSAQMNFDQHLRVMVPSRRLRLATADKASTSHVRTDGVAGYKGVE